jgi:hypothetical protein
MDEAGVSAHALSRVAAPSTAKSGGGDLRRSANR